MRQVAEETPPIPPALKPHELIYSAWRKELGKPDLPMGDAWGIIGARLKEGFPVEALCKAAIGARLDAERWPERAAQNEIKFVYGSAGQVRKFVDLAERGNPAERPKTDVRRGIQRAEDQGWENVPYAQVPK